MDTSKGRGLFVTGTDTGVGKTLVTAGLAAAIGRLLGGSGAGTRIRCWKPVQTGTAPDAPDADSRRLARLSGLPEGRAACAVDARRARRHVRRLERARRRRRRSAARRGRRRVGGAGHRRAARRRPAARAGLPVLVVARARLGTVNHTLLTLHCARDRGLEVAGVVPNGALPGEERELAENVRMIETFGGISVIAALDWHPEPPADAGSGELGRWRTTWVRHVTERMRWDLLDRYIRA